MFVRKCNDNEMEKIIVVADKCFLPDRTSGFTFRKSMPRIYDNKNRDYSDIHFVAEDEQGEFVGVAGNLIDTINIDEKQYKFSRVGTVGTIPQLRGKGVMKSLMRAVDEENIEEKVVFSVLCGKRDRYKNYGYERAGLTSYYTFDKVQAKYLTNDFGLSFRPYKQSDLELLYKVYLENEKFILRNKEEFEILLNNSKVKLFTIICNKNVAGYFALKGGTIVELNLINEKHIESLLWCILNSEKIDFCINKYNSQTIQFAANSLRQGLCRQLDKIAEYKALNDELSIKVYDFERFMEMLFDLNPRSKQKNITENYKIGDDTYKFEITDGKIKIALTDEEFLYEFLNKQNFIRFALGNDLLFEKISNIFPLLFDINVLDNF